MAWPRPYKDFRYSWKATFSPIMFLLIDSSIFITDGTTPVSPAEHFDTRQRFNRNVHFLFVFFKVFSDMSSQSQLLSDGGASPVSAGSWRSCSRRWRRRAPGPRRRSRGCAGCLCRTGPWWRNASRCRSAAPSHSGSSSPERVEDKRKGRDEGKDSY